MEIRTGISPVSTYTMQGGQKITYAQAELFTGKSHQIRAHFASIGHCLLGDSKYGDPALNRQLAPLKIRGQMLHAYQIIFPDQIEGTFSYLAGKTMTADEPDSYRILRDSCRDTGGQRPTQAAHKPAHKGAGKGEV